MPANKIIKRSLITIGVIIFLILLSAILIPVLFKDKILAVVKKELNERLNATSDFKDVSLTLFSHFPHLTVSIGQLSIINKAPFAGDTLIAAKQISVTVDVMQAIHGNYDVLDIDLNTPRILAIKDDQGNANWNITKPDTTAPSATGPAKPFAFKLRAYSIKNGYITYKDEVGKLYAQITNLNHSGSGDFTSDNFTLKTTTNIDALTFSFGNIPYLNQLNTALDLDLEIDTKAGKYTFNTDKIQLNGLRLAAKGYVEMPDTLRTEMDIQFSTPSNNFRDILSLIPGIYKDNFKDIKTTGTVALNGFVKGTYSKNSIPAFNVNLAVKDGSFQYPALPSKVADIQIKMQASNADGVPDHTVVNIEQGHINFSGEPFDFRLLLKTPVSDANIDASVKGRIDLSELQKIMKLEAGTKLTGIISADVTAKGPISAATKKEYDKLNAAGTIQVTNLYYASKDYPDGVNVDNLLLSFNPQNVTVTGFKGAYLQTNFTADGSIDNLLGYYLHNEPLNGKLNLTADKIDVNKWMGTPSSTTAAPTKSSTATTAFQVPANLGFVLVAQAGTVVYNNLTLTNVKGNVVIQDQTVYLQSVTGQALDGTIEMTGSYSTKVDKANPDMAFSYSVQAVDIQKTYAAFVTVQKIMPVGKYISGKVTSQLTMKGKLGPDMSPIMNTLSGDGNLLILNGQLSNFAPLEQLADKLNISLLKSIPLKDMKNYFHFADGRVIIDPYQFTVNNIAFQIAGSHGFDQTLKYGLNIAVPRAMMGSQGNALVDNLVNQAKSKGIPAQVSDKVNLAVTIGGTMTKPVIQTDLKQMAGDAVNEVKQQITAEVNKRVDSAKAVAKDTLNSIKKQAVAAAKNQLINALQNGGKDTTKGKGLNNAVNQGQQSVKGALNNLFNKNK